MPDTIDTIFQRRTIRRYQDIPVERDKLEPLLHRAMAAPSACNSQPWEFIVATEAEVLDRLREKKKTAKHNSEICHREDHGRSLGK